MGLISVQVDSSEPIIISELSNSLKLMILQLETPQRYEYTDMPKTTISQFQKPTTRYNVKQQVIWGDFLKMVY